MPKSVYFTNSEFGTFKQCKRKWFLSYYLKRQPRRHSMSKPLNTGILGHEALMIFYRSGGDTAKVLAWLDARKAADIEAAFAVDQSAIADIHELTRAIFEGYVWWLENTGADHRLKIESVERAYEIDGPVFGTKLLGKVDFTGVDVVTGKILIVDHKFVDGFGRTIPTLNLNEQAPLYMMLRAVAEPDERPAVGVVWNMLRRVKRGPKAKPPFYARHEVYITETMLNRYWDQLFGQITDIHRVEEALDGGADHQVVAYPSPHQDCSWKCPYFGVCGLMNDPASDYESVLEFNFEIGDPLKRYEEEDIE